ncbi:MAG: hypothetical protein ACHQ2Y_08880 [Candidatus Lutacidiplasmatales archaeon]
MRLSGFIILIAVLAALPSVMSHAPSSPPLASSPRGVAAVAHDSSSAACETILATNPGLTSGAFLEICNESTFAQALQAAGASNFSIDTMRGPGVSFVYYGFDWVANCTNATWANLTGKCAEQEFWSVNLVNNTIAGPSRNEAPASCMGCLGEVPAPYLPLAASPSNLGPILVTVSAAVLGAAAVLLLRRVRRGTDPP